jgi:hypothetical protein
MTMRAVPVPLHMMPGEGSSSSCSSTGRTQFVCTQGSRVLSVGLLSR